MVFVRICAFALAALLLAAASASADTVTIQFKDTAGVNDPVSGIGRTLSISGNTPIAKSLYIKVRAPGGAPCAPSADSDSGSGLGSSGIYTESGYYGYQGRFNGDFAVNRAGVWSRAAGTYMFCAWLADDDSTPTQPITQNITFRAMAGSISGSVASTVIATRTATASVTGSSEGPAYAYAKFRRAGGAPCAATHEADAGESILQGESVNGSFTFAPELTPATPGDHVLCLWLAKSSEDPEPIAGPQPVLFSALRPCVVPTVGARMTIKGAQRKLRAAGCTTGTVRFKHSRSVRRGRVIRFRPGSGKELAPSAKVTLVISRGR